MKKILKSRNDYMETTNAINNAPPETASKPTEEAKPVTVHPPLPPYPPPPDSPPNLNVIIKQEKEDVDIQQYDIDSNYNLPNPETTEGEQKTMCKMFARGECNRLVCKYAHEMILSQLRGVYTFCWNYQNVGCTFPYCRYVHATIFEEAEFYRTGYLPPHIRSRLNKPIAPPTLTENQTQIPVDFSIPPPSHRSGMDNPMPVMSYVPASHHTDMDTPRPVMSYVPGSHQTDMDKPMPVMSFVPPASNVEQRPTDNFTVPPPYTSSSLKRGWRTIEDNSSLLTLEKMERLEKENAKIVKLSRISRNIILESSKRDADDIKKKIDIMLMNSLINELLLTLMKPANTPQPVVTNTGDGDIKTLLEELASFISSTNKQNVSNLFGNNFSNG